MTATGYRRIARALITDLVLLDWSGRRPRARVLIWLLALTAYAVWRCAGTMAAPMPFSPDGHAAASFNLAIDDAWCGQRGRLSDTYQIGQRLISEPRLASRPVRAVIEETAGSMTAYCGTVKNAFSNNEHSLEVLEAILLRLAGPSATAETIGRALFALRMAIVVAFCGAVLIAGGSVLMCIGVIEIGLALGQLMTYWSCSLYPFVFAMPLLSIALYVWLLDRADTGARPGDWVLLAGVGLAASLGANMRTSHLPVYVVLFALFLWFRRPATLGTTAATLLVVCVGYLAGHWYIVERRQLAGVTYNSSYHTVAHPLVLSLAVPENRLSRSEGIYWQDGIGPVLANRVDPSATFLGPAYERALFRYYWSLWRQHPRMMAAIYLHKFNVAGDTMVAHVAGDSRPLWLLLKPWTTLTNGFARLWAMTTLLVGSALAYRRRHHLFAALVAMLSVAALALQFEMAMIMPSFALNFHGFTVFYAAMIGIVTAQVVVNIIVWLAMRGRRAADD